MARGLNRRKFLQSVLGGTCGVAASELLTHSTRAQESRQGANSRIGVAFIGCGRRGISYMAGGLPPRMQVVAACDVHLARAEAAARMAGCPDAVQDYRRVLDRKDVDAVMIATPDHWHALQAIEACQAGKHVYVEKPMTMCVVEGRRMVEAARKHSRIVQVGSQQRSTAPNRDGCALVRKGGIGHVKQVIAPNLTSPWNCDFPAQAVPAELDWDKWCGPSPLRPYHASLYECEGSPGWMECRDFSVGNMGNWGGHALDQVQWALGADSTGPIKVFVDGPPLDVPSYSEPESRERGWRLCGRPMISFEYASRTRLELSHGPLSGAIFVGEDGKVEIRRGSVHSNPLELIENVQLADGPTYTRDHIDNWLDSIESGALPVADVEIGHRTATVCHLGNIGRLLGRNLRWDPAGESFLGDDEANQLLDRPRRKGYELPIVI